MANYKHGVYVSETATSLIPTVNVDSAIPFVVGIAPVNGVSDPHVNEPVLVNSYKEAVAALGFEPAQKVDAAGNKKFRFGISEFMYANFNFAGIVPCILVNVLDPSKHRTALDTKTVTIAKGTGTIAELGVLPSTLSLTNAEGVAYTDGTDYETAFDDDGYLVVNVIGSKISDGDLTIATGFKIDPTAVSKADIIGGIDAATGKKKGLELISDVYPKFRVIPTLILAPGFSTDPEVASIMAAKAVNINGHFNALALCDAPVTGTTKTYSNITEWKNQNSVTNAQQVVCWPKVRNAETVYSLSTILAGVIGTTDNANGNVPYCSPSNNAAPITGLCDDDGGEIVIGNEEANYLNGQGVVTCLNFTSGWVIWGNRTASYPGNTDPKDSFIPVKRMFYWVENTVTLTAWQKVDKPMNRRLVHTVVDSLNVWINGLVSREQLLGGKLEFREDDNTTTELMDGIMHFKFFMTPPSPARDMEFDFEIDTSYYSTLFE